MTAPVDYRNAAVYLSTCGPEAKGILYSIGNPPGGPARETPYQYVQCPLRLDANSQRQHFGSVLDICWLWRWRKHIAMAHDF